MLNLDYQLAYVREFANTLICKSLFESGSPLPNFLLLIIGLIMLGICFIVGFIVPFYFIDGMVRVGIVGALMPAFIFFWVFPKTRKYSVVAFNMLINIAFLFIIISAIMFLNMVLIGSIFAGNFDMATFQLDQGHLDEVQKLLNLAGASLKNAGGIFTMLLLGFFVFKLTTLAPEMAESLSNTHFGNDTGSKLVAAGMVMGWDTFTRGLRKGRAMAGKGRDLYNAKYGKKGGGGESQTPEIASSGATSNPGVSRYSMPAGDPSANGLGGSSSSGSVKVSSGNNT